MPVQAEVGTTPPRSQGAIDKALETQAPGIP